MLNLRRIRTFKWTGALMAILLLSQSFGRWRAFAQTPSALSYAGILLALSLFLLLMAALAVLVYAEEKAMGRILRPRPLFDRLSHRFFGAR
jgi:hypothetical protein